MRMLLSILPPRTIVSEMVLTKTAMGSMDSTKMRMGLPQLPAVDLTVMTAMNMSVLTMLLTYQERILIFVRHPFMEDLMKFKEIS